MQTVVVQIGNSDDKLTQKEWSLFCAETELAVRKHCEQIHFYGGSPWNTPWQNACFVAEIKPEAIESFCQEITIIRGDSQQDSVAVTFGETTFI